MREEGEPRSDLNRPTFEKTYPPEVAAQRENWLGIIADVRACYVWPDPGSPTLTGLPQLKLTPDEWAAIKCQYLVEVEPFIHELVKLALLASYKKFTLEKPVEP